MTIRKILITDDEPDIRNVVSILLSSNGYSVTEAQDASAAIAAVKENPDFDLIILDVMMPGMDGIEALKVIRTFSNVPTLFLTAKTQEMDKAQAYESGADDYLPKPFSQNELLMKVSSLIRRYREYNDFDKKSDAADALAVFEFDKRNRKVLKDGKDVSLTDTEYDMLMYFMSRRGTPTDTKTIYEAVWEEKYLPSAANTVMVHILNLRKKIEVDPTQPVILKTMWGKGYQID